MLAMPYQGLEFGIISEAALQIVHLHWKLHKGDHLDDMRRIVCALPHMLVYMFIAQIYHITYLQKRKQFWKSHSIAILMTNICRSSSDAYLNEGDQGHNSKFTDKPMWPDIELHEDPAAHNTSNTKKSPSRSHNGCFFNFNTKGWRRDILAMPWNCMQCGDLPCKISGLNAPSLNACWNLLVPSTCQE